jgi:hypothetical protein
LGNAAEGVLRTLTFSGLRLQAEQGNSGYGPVYVSLSGCNIVSETVIVADRVEGDDEPDEPVAEAAVAPQVVLTIGSLAMKVGDGTITMDAAPYIEDGYTMAPVSFVARALGIPADGVKWDEEARTVTIDIGDGVAVLTIDSRQMSLRGVVVEMPKAPAIRDGRSFLPFRVLGEQVLGATVDWDADAGTATFF